MRVDAVSSNVFSAEPVNRESFYAVENALKAKRSLPEFFWTGETEFRCLEQAIGQTRTLAEGLNPVTLEVHGIRAGLEKLPQGDDPDKDRYRVSGSAGIKGKGELKVDLEEFIKTFHR